MSLMPKLKLCALFLIPATSCFAAEKPPVFRPTFSFLGTFTSTKNFSYLNDGKFTVENKKGNFGFELSNKFYAAEDYFVRTGIRYHQYEKAVTALNQVPEIYDFPISFSWQLKAVFD